MNERDERPLSEIQFALDERDPAERERIAVRIRGMLALVGVKTAQDIIELGCTGLVVSERGGLSMLDAQFVRQNMAGSICGLPCYVPPDRFCLVHNSIGALQLKGNADGPQLMRHPEGVPRCSRELTEEETKALGAIRQKIGQDAAEAAKALGLKATASEVTAQEVDPLADTSKRPLTNGGIESGGNCGSFVCVEHTEFNPACRFCLAQAVAEGPLQPEIEMRAYSPSEAWSHYSNSEPLSSLLGNSAISRVDFYVLAARWVRKLTRE